MLQAETAGALDSMTGDGPSAPSGDGPQSPVDFDATDASNSSISTHGAGADQLPHEASVTSRQARPAPWPLHAAGSGTPMSRQRQNDGSTHKIFDYPETPGTGATEHRSSRAHVSEKTKTSGSIFTNPAIQHFLSGG